jgi:hypothetical protein
MNTGAQEVLNSTVCHWSVVADGRTSQPSRQPVIKKTFEKLRDHHAVIGLRQVQKAGAAPCGVGRSKAAHTPSARIQVLVRRQCARMVSCSGRVSVQPVGLWGR